MSIPDVVELKIFFLMGLLFSIIYVLVIWYVRFSKWLFESKSGAPYFGFIHGSR